MAGQHSETTRQRTVRVDWRVTLRLARRLVRARMDAAPVDRPLAPPAPRSTGRLVRTVLLVAVFVYVTARLAALRLGNYPYPLDLAAAWTGIGETVRATLPPLAIVWTALALAIASLGGWLRRRAPDLLLSEAALGAVVVLWATTDVVLLVLGPTGWYRPSVLRAIFLLVVVMGFRLARG